MLFNIIKVFELVALSYKKSDNVTKISLTLFRTANLYWISEDSEDPLMADKTHQNMIFIIAYLGSLNICILDLC